jgi:hypothetical protein
MKSRKLDIEITGESKSFFGKVLILLFSIIFLGIFLNYASKDERSLTSNTYLYAFTALIPIMMVFIFAINRGNLFSVIYNKSVLIGIMLSLCLIVIIYRIYKYLDATSLFLVKIIVNILIFLIILIGLAIFFKMTANNLLKSGGTSRFIILLIFYIPCFVSDCIQSIKEELKVTPNIVYILLILEVILITSYFFLSRLHIPSNGVKLHDGKLFLDTTKKLTISDSSKINIPMMNELLVNDVNNNDRSRKIFCLSMWVYVNAPEMNNISFPIISYGNTNTNGKPHVSYTYDVERSQYVLAIQFSDTGGSISKFIIPNQRWNNLVFNYNGSNVDLFINGILTKSVSLINNLPTFNISDMITVGSNEKGINGAIANITYYNEPLNAMEVLGYYRLGINTIHL